MDQVMPMAPCADLNDLLAASSKHEFTALSSGLGLGGVRPARPIQARPPVAQAAASLAVNTMAGWAGSAAATPRLGPPAAATAAPAKEAGISRLVLAWSLDLLLVAAALSSALALVFAAHVWRGDSADWLAAKQVQWLLSLNPVVWLAGVYSLFLVYAIFFRILVGRTCGETLLGLRPTPLGQPTKG